MEILALGPDDEALADHTTVVNAARAVDAPWLSPRTQREAEGIYRWGGALDPATPYLLRDDRGEAVAAGEISTSPYENPQLAWLDVIVVPDRRRRGHGSALLHRLLADARSDHRTSVGLSGWDAAATRGFAAAHGFEERMREIVRHHHLDDLDRGRVACLREEAAAAASGYELLRRLGPLPADELDAVAEMMSAINDAPMDDLVLDDDVYDARRVRAYEESHAARGITLYRVQARHRATGELAGETAVAVDPEHPTEAEQHGTQVVRAHRGHRLGLLLKADMLAWLAEAEPQLRSIETWNAESNDHMVGVNETLGYTWTARELSFQRDL